LGVERGQHMWRYCTVVESEARCRSEMGILSRSILYYILAIFGASVGILRLSFYSHAIESDYFTLYIRYLSLASLLALIMGMSVGESADFYLPRFIAKKSHAAYVALVLSLFVIALRRYSILLAIAVLSYLILPSLSLRLLQPVFLLPIALVGLSLTLTSVLATCTRSRRRFLVFQSFHSVSRSILPLGLVFFITASGYGYYLTPSVLLWFDGVFSMAISSVLLYSLLSDLLPTSARSVWRIILLAFRRSIRPFSLLFNTSAATYSGAGRIFDAFPSFVDKFILSFKLDPGELATYLACWSVATAIEIVSNIQLQPIFNSLGSLIAASDQDRSTQPVPLNLGISQVSIHIVKIVAVGAGLMGIAVVAVKLQLASILFKGAYVSPGLLIIFCFVAILSAVASLYSQFLVVSGQGVSYFVISLCFTVAFIGLLLTHDIYNSLMFIAIGILVLRSVQAGLYRMAISRAG
jgi:hypothetical protein